MKKPALRCPACETALRLAVSPATGQRVRCPTCKEVFAAPAPKVDEPELVQEVDGRGAIAERPRAGGKTSARLRGDSNVQDEEADEIVWDDEDEPRRQKKGVPRVVWIALGGALLIGAIALYKFGLKGGHTVKLGVGKAATDHAELLRQRAAVYKEMSYHYRRIHSEKDAESRRMRLRELEDELADCEKRGPELGKFDVPKMRELNLELNEAFAQAMDDREAAVQAVPSIRDIIYNP